MPNPIQLCSDRIRAYETRQVYGESAMLKAQVIRDLEELREAVTAMKADMQRKLESQRVMNGQLRRKIEEQDACTTET